MSHHSREQELFDACPAETRAVLKAKLHLIERGRDDRATDAYHLARNAAAAGRRLGHSATAAQLWEGAEREAEAAVDSMIEACLECGVGDTEIIATYVGADLRQFLTAFATSRIQPDYQGVANELTSRALAKQSRVKARVVTLAFDRKRSTEKMTKTINVAVHGGNVQVGDGNTQSVSYATFLTNLAEAIEKSSEAPPEKKAAWANALKELAAHPLTQTLISAAAGAATGGA